VSFIVALLLHKALQSCFFSQPNAVSRIGGMRPILCIRRISGNVLVTLTSSNVDLRDIRIVKKVGGTIKASGKVL